MMTKEATEIRELAKRMGDPTERGLELDLLQEARLHGKKRTDWPGTLKSLIGGGGLTKEFDNPSLSVTYKASNEEAERLRSTSGVIVNDFIKAIENTGIFLPGYGLVHDFYPKEGIVLADSLNPDIEFEQDSRFTILRPRIRGEFEELSIKGVYEDTSNDWTASDISQPRNLVKGDFYRNEKHKSFASDTSVDNILHAYVLNLTGQNLGETQ